MSVVSQQYNLNKPTYGFKARESFYRALKKVFFLLEYDTTSFLLR
jgi:hypothetical protein